MKKSKMKKITELAVLCLIFVLLLPGCRKKQEEDSRTNMGVDDGIGGFLYNFDMREEVSQLVREKKQGIFPQRVTWYYEKGGTAREEDGEVKSNTLTSDDPELIKELYYALGNVIIVGIAIDQSKYTHYFITFEMPDGTECRFNFVSENTIRLSGQNYVVETDGTLWKTLIGATGAETVTEVPEFEEDVTESADETALEEAWLAEAREEQPEETLTEAADESVLEEIEEDREETSSEETTEEPATEETTEEATEELTESGMSESIYPS